MEVSQVVGVRTRARTMALAAAEAATAAMGGTSKRTAAMRGTSKRTATVTPELQISYLQLRSRSLVMTPRIARSANSSAARRSTPERGRISRCSSNASCEVLEKDVEEPRWLSADLEGSEGFEKSECYSECSRERRETTPSSNRRDESGDLESTADRKTRKSPLSEAMPSEAEIDEFFATAERAQKRRFVDKYNFDVDMDVPLSGRYEWVQLKP